MDKKQAYQELISDVKEYYKAQEATYKDDPIFLTWYIDVKRGQP